MKPTWTIGDFATITTVQPHRNTGTPGPFVAMRTTNTVKTFWRRCYDAMVFDDHEVAEARRLVVFDPEKIEQPERVVHLRELIDAAHREQRQVWDAERGQEPMTLEQHWSATAGWLASRIRQIERTGEPDWPDAMNSAEPAGADS